MDLRIFGGATGCPRDDRVIRYIPRRKLKLGFLIVGCVSGWCVGGEGVLEILLVRLTNGGWKRRECRQNVVRNAESLLRFRR